MPRIACYLSAALLALGATGCTTAKGTPCAKSSTCDKGLECHDGVCVTVCTTDSQCASQEGCGQGYCAPRCKSQTDCPNTQECGLPTTAATTATCYDVQYKNPDAGGFGVGCSNYSCNLPDAGTLAPNPCDTDAGYACSAAANCDPNAVCTAGCSQDLDCPAPYFCVSPGTESDGGMLPKICLPRTLCDPCAVDDQCEGPSTQTNFVCAHDDLGGRFCAQPCDPGAPDAGQQNADCLKPFKTTDQSNNEVSYGAFDVCIPDPVTGANVCTPGQGACHGKSAITSITGDGQICSACRPGFPEDCASTGYMGCSNGNGGCFPCATGTSPNCSFSEICIDTSNPGETFCSLNCTVNMDLTSSSLTFANDTCPAGSFCFYGGYGALGDIAAQAYSDGIMGCGPCVSEGTGACACSLSLEGNCTADPQRNGDTCFLP